MTESIRRLQSLYPSIDSYYKGMDMAIRGPYDSGSASGTPTTLGERLKALRIRKGLTQQELSAALNTDQTIISTWERDKSRPSGPALAAIAYLFNVTPEQLSTGASFVLPPQESQPKGVTQVAFPDIVNLPRHPEGASALVLDLATNAQNAIEPYEALNEVMQTLQEGRRIWIVKG